MLHGNLKDIREACWARCSWGPSGSTEAVARWNTWINLAMYELLSEVPFVFSEERLTLHTEPDKIPTLSTDVVSVVNNDRYVFAQELAQGTTDLVVLSAGFDEGRWVEIKDSSGVWRRRRIRDIWAANYKGGTHVHFSIFRPWITVTDADLEYRVFTDDYYLPEDIITLKSARLVNADQEDPMTVYGELEAEDLGLVDLDLDVVTTGPPDTIVDRPHFQLQGPTEAPGISRSSGNDVWTGPEPYGKFEFCYTYVWGYRHTDQILPGPLSNASASTQGWTPRFESAPSPVSDPVTVGASSTFWINISTANIDFQQGFGITGLDRLWHGGWKKRIYVRRVTSDFTNYGSLTSTEATLGQGGVPAANLHNPNVFYFLAEVEGYDEEQTWKGDYTPDFHTRLPAVHGYRGVRFHPRPDDTYEVALRVLRRPQRLADDFDVPPLHRDAVDAIVLRALMYFYEAEKNLAMKADAERGYNKRLAILSKRYGSLRSNERPFSRKRARVRGMGGPTRRWYSRDDI